MEVPLQRGFSARAGLRIDHFRRLAATLAPFVELSYAGSWWDARISASRSHQALASVRDEEALGASFLENEGIFPLPRPGPSFGIEGEGVYGCLDGVVPSRASRIWVR